MSESGFEGGCVGIMWDPLGPFHVFVLDVDDFSIDPDAVFSSPWGGWLYHFDGDDIDVASLEVGESWHHCLDTGSSLMELDDPLMGFGAFFFF
jgi:hypothetical protein